MVLARRNRESPQIFIDSDRRSRNGVAGPGVASGSFGGSITCHLRREHRHPASPIPTGSSPGTTPGVITHRGLAGSVPGRLHRNDRQLRLHGRRQRDQEFIRFIDLPSRSDQPLGSRSTGATPAARPWVASRRCDGVSRSLWDRDFIHRSKAEFGVAKHTYVATRWDGSATERIATWPPAAGAGTGCGWTGAPAARADRSLLDARRRRGHRPHQQRLRHHARAAAEDRTRHFAAPHPCRSCWRSRAHEPAAEDRPHRSCGNHDSAPKSGSVVHDPLLTRDSSRPDTTSRSSPRRIRRRRRSCTPSTLTATGTTKTCGRGRCTRC